MKKIPTLFVREYEERTNGKGKRIVGVKDELTSPDLQCVLDGECIATIKYDGSSVALINNKWYKRYDAKGAKRKKKLENKYGDTAIATQEHSDPITGSKPYWVPIVDDDPADKWFVKATQTIYSGYPEIPDWSYEAIGPHFQSNPHKLTCDCVIPHGQNILLDLSHRQITKEEIESYLTENMIEGIVFWGEGETLAPEYNTCEIDYVWDKKYVPICKIKRSDFCLPWPEKEKK